MTYRLVEPVYVDLSRHVASPAGVRRYHKPLGSLISKSPTSKSHVLRFEGKTRQLRVDEAEEIGRRSLTMTEGDRKSLFEAHGFNSEFPDISNDDLYSEWSKAVGNRKERLLSEIHTRAEAMLATVELVREAEKGRSREHLRQKTSDHWDDVLGKSKPGRVLLAIRNRLITDKALDRVGEFSHEIREFGKEWRFRIAEGRIASWLVQGMVALAGAGAGKVAGSAGHAGEVAAAGEHANTAEQIAEQVHVFLENPTTEAAIGAVVGMGLLAGAKLLHRRSIKKKVTKTFDSISAAPKGAHEA
jgi:hypothetical protein